MKFRGAVPQGVRLVPERLPSQGVDDRIAGDDPLGSAADLYPLRQDLLGADPILHLQAVIPQLHGVGPRRGFLGAPGLQNADLPAQGGEIDRQLQARGPGAQDDAPTLGQGRVRINRDGVLRPVQSGDGGGGGHRTQGGDHSIRFQFRAQGGGDLRIQPNLHAQLFQHIFLPLDILPDPLLEGDFLLAQEHPAQGGSLLAEDHFMAELPGGNGGLHPGYPSAGDEHPAVALGLRYSGSLPLLPGGGIDGAEQPAILVILANALEAPQAFPGFLLPAGFGLQGKIRVADEPPGHLHDIRLAGGDDLLQHVQVGEAADGGHVGLLHVLFDLRSVFDVHPLLLENPGVGVKIRSGGEQIAAGNMDDVRVAVQLFGNLHALLDAVAALEGLTAADPHLHGEIPPAAAVDLIHHADGKTAAVLRASAPFVRPPVGLGAVELMQQPAVARVDHHHAEAPALGILRGGGVSVDGGQDLLLRHGPGLHPAVIGVEPVAGAQQEHLPRGVALDPAGLLQLDGGHRPVPGDGVSQLAQGFLIPLMLGEVGDLIAVGRADALVIDVAFPDIDGGAPALGLPLIISNIIVRGCFFRGEVIEPGGRGEQAVAEHGVPDPKRLQNVRVFRAACHRCILLMLVMI